MIIYRGAEAIIEKIDENTIVKKRIEKKYRLREIDEKIGKERTKKEVKFLKEVRRFGINAPQVLEVSDFEFKMEYINGKKLKDILNKENFNFFAEEIGKIVANLHLHNIVHNDLTLSNMIYYENKIYLIDFGLANYSVSIENKAEDVLTLYYSIKSLFPEIYEDFFRIFKDTYTKLYPNGNNVIERMKEILKRGRYSIRNGN
ncbi:MAG: KEOPS complex kinase/ATPase Bud32 [Candidatus Aenigmatarchaeota archaeon]